MRESVVVAVLVVLVHAVASQCPEFESSPLPKCDQKTDHELCILAAHKDSDRLSDFEFMNGPIGLEHADPLACKLRAAAIRQHVLYHGSRGHGSTNCKRAAAVFKTNTLPNARVGDVCEQIGFPKCGVCRHGGRMVEEADGSCTCECTDSWRGKDCSECALSPVECLHNGTVVSSEKQCECSCQYPWSGLHCDQCNRQCKHGGFSDPTDPRCGCQCLFPWAGTECTECPLQCQHGGRLVSTKDSCMCECPVLASGPQCEQCTARCLNGGVLDKATCTCKCPGGFTGHQCEICDLDCKYNGTFVPNDCRCQCTNPFTSGQDCGFCSNDCHGRGREVGCNCVDCEGYWTGNSCSECSLRCVNEGELNQRSCKCSCDAGRCKHGQFKDDCSCECDGFWRGEMCDTCHINCVHGVRARELDTCACRCDGHFTGARCDKCEHNCTGRGLLDENLCECTDCIAPYYGHDCTSMCPKTCQHGSVLDLEHCECKNCVLPWMGPECSVCKLLVNLTSQGTPCGPHGSFDSSTCHCKCEEGWTGERCDRCSRTCMHGTLDPATCSCSCDQHWGGVNCTDCTMECQNGGVVDKKMCYCHCDRMHSGTYCQGGPCFMQQSCDACLSTSDGCEWCAKTASCGKKPAPGGVSGCTGPIKTGICPTYGECHICDYTPSELAWLENNGDATLGSVQSLDVLMDEPGAVPESEVCDTDRGMTWCEDKRMCVQDWEGGINGPCQSVLQALPRARHALNGFISTEASITQQ